MVSNLTQVQSTPKTSFSKGAIAPLNPFPSRTSTATATVLGAGAWGSALATLLRRNGHDVRVWSRRSNETLEEAIAGVDVIVSAIPMKGVSATVEALQEFTLPANMLVVTATKGLDPNTAETPSQIWQQAFPEHPVVVLSGPNLSKEIQQGLPAASVAASTSPQAAEEVQKLFSSDAFRVYTNDDPLGTELGGTLKNVIAIAAGICDGLELGTNAKAALISRALAEMVRVGLHFGAKAETFCGLSGLGDLLATCDGPLSRNYRVGQGLATGKSLTQVLEDLKSTAEGVNTTQVLMGIAQENQLDLPIARCVYGVIREKVSPHRAVEGLMGRELTAE